MHGVAILVFALIIGAKKVFSDNPILAREVTTDE